MASRRTSHAVYETKYPLVWTPKSRKGMLRGARRERGEALFHESAQYFGFAIDTLAVAGDSPIQAISLLRRMAFATSAALTW
jgi:putative transposase